MNVCEISAIVRKSEPEDYLNLVWNDPGKGEMNHVDCSYLAGLFRFGNFLEGSKAYLEYVVPEEEQGEAFPLPATANSTLEPIYGSKFYYGNVGKFGLLGLAGVGLAALI